LNGGLRSDLNKLLYLLVRAGNYTGFVYINRFWKVFFGDGLWGFGDLSLGIRINGTGLVFR